ncbi:MAG: hypothetical protein LBL91_00160 [Lachnospiraceae bacterium]|jgi:hypothetical protein|nr:hypothetical protein [Lachnospiraceae bacterium]
MWLSSYINSIAVESEVMRMIEEAMLKIILLLILGLVTVTIIAIALIIALVVILRNK